MENSQSPETLLALSELGQHISRARRRRSLTQQDLANRASVSLATISRMERGDAGVALGSALEILLILDPQWLQSLVTEVRSDPMGIELTNQQLPARVKSNHGF